MICWSSLHKGPKDYLDNKYLQIECALIGVDGYMVFFLIFIDE